MTTARAILVASCVLLAAAWARGGDLAEEFGSPPAAARPWVYWFWLNGNINREGITADLEAMKRVGIGGVLIMEVDQGAPKGPARFGSPQWRELFKFVCCEAHRLGLEVNMNNDAGWCGSGGPWITPELSMQKVVWSETSVAGPRRFEGRLPQPQATANFYRDIAVLAVPQPAGDEVKLSDLSPKVTTSDGHAVEAKKPFDRNTPTAIYAAAARARQAAIRAVRAGKADAGQLVFAGRSRVGRPSSAAAPCRFPRMAARSGRVREFRRTAGGLTLNFPESRRGCSGSFSRTRPPGSTGWGWSGGNLPGLSRSRTSRARRRSSAATSAAAGAISGGRRRSRPSPRQSHRRSDRRHGRGRPSPGTCRRASGPSCASATRRTGVDNHPAPEAGLGLECDKLSKEGARGHFDGLMGKLIADVGPLAGKTLVSTHIDSWETGSQNWTPRLREEFRRAARLRSAAALCRS